MDLWREVVTGASDGTAVGVDPVYGSFEIEMVRGSESLTIVGAKTAFICAMPEADPEGGAAEVELAGIAYRTTDTPITVTLVNAQASY